MITLISPAKSLDYNTAVPIAQSTQPRFPDKTGKLVSAASNLSKKRLKDIMPVSDNLIELNYGRYKDFHNQPERQAIYAFSGDVYTGFEARTLDEAAIDYAQDHLRILSGLYGLLRPLDNIRPYRLEMGTRWAPRYKSLVDFWGDAIAQQLSHDLAEQNSNIILNLASQEYFASVTKGVKKLDAEIVNVDFRQDGPDGPRFISFAAKKARGMMARFVCEHRLDDIESVKSFDSDGYAYDASGSDQNTLRFIRA
ncbi:peroxide stress protein YaaA [Sphingorhabdus sp. Alg239-R122]|uniref:peroxide stress protein YaaA n=1 Tax=Sphingorhabdus sp. Alg239-R122 TaxID=2305989 RepID=UPI0013D96668|nr:peroxide stress protein YaaA [Sphingorhabdus sp. Alg239-R122]